MLSGGLDSALACCVLKDQGIEVHAVYIAMPWGCGNETRAKRIAEDLAIPLKVIPLGDDYLPILTDPKFGFGSAHNPCVDCHIYMVKKAAEHMREIHGAFVFTGEVVGQRPMSQRRECLGWVERESGLEGRILRPLSASFLDPTIPENEGVVDRTRLPSINGRSRKAQYALAEKYGLKHFAQPGGGCLLTEKHFGERLGDVLGRGVSTIAETAVLGLGRYFRLSEDAFVILGRDQKENEGIIARALAEDWIIRPFSFPGPVALLRARDVSQEMLAKAAGLCQYFSKSREQAPRPVKAWRGSSVDQVQDVLPDLAGASGFLVSPGESSNSQKES
ncbi:MAG: hypothetical protein GX606_05245 [Elusimicrobia bacterium]|nr:hypothetical protein [Elusimicrobiota bacterium]